MCIIEISQKIKNEMINEIKQHQNNEMKLKYSKKFLIKKILKGSI